MTRKRGSIECGGHGLDVFVFTLEPDIYFLELPWIVAVKVALYGRGLRVEGDERNEKGKKKKKKKRRRRVIHGEW